MPRYNKVNKITNQCSFQLKFDDNTGSNFKIANKRNKIKKFSNRAIHLLSYNKLHVPWLFSSVLDKFFLQLLTPWSYTNHFLQGIDFSIGILVASNMTRVAGNLRLKSSGMNYSMISLTCQKLRSLNSK